MMENIKYTFFSQENAELKKLYGEEGNLDKLEEMMVVVVKDNISRLRKTSKINDGAEIEIVIPSIKIK